jgi:hypothetical protein
VSLPARAIGPTWIALLELLSVVQALEDLFHLLPLYLDLLDPVHLTHTELAHHRAIRHRAVLLRPRKLHHPQRLLLATMGVEVWRPVGMA